jgi:hypothetical protein
MTPESVLTASRAAISLPSAEADMRTAAGDADPTSSASTSAFGVTR